MFCEIVVNVLLTFLGLFPTSSVLITVVLLLTLSRYLLCSSRLININCSPYISKAKCKYASGPLWYSLPLRLSTAFCTNTLSIMKRNISERWSMLICYFIWHTPCSNLTERPTVLTGGFPEFSVVCRLPL